MNEPTNQTAVKKANRWRAILIFVASLVVVYAAYRIALFSFVNARIQAIRRSGLPATLQELDKWYAQIPSGENAADLYQLADERGNKWTNALAQPVLVSNGNCSFDATMRSGLLPVVGFAKSPSRTERLSPETKQLVRDYLADNAEALQILHKAATRRGCRFPVDLSQRYTNTLSYLSQSRNAARLLTLEAMETAEDQQPETAAESLIAQAGLVRSYISEPWLISYFTAMALQGMTIESVEQVINKTTLTEEQLKHVAAGLEKVDDTLGLFNALIGERCSEIDTFQLIRSRKAAVVDLFGAWQDEKPPWYAAVSAVYGGAGLLERDELVYLRMMDGLIQAARLPPPKNIFAAKDVMATLKGLSVQAVITGVSTNYLDPTVTHNAKALARLRTAITALVIERYRLQNNTLPESLAVLVPAFLPTIPEDPFDGKPLRYKRSERGYVVYSVGEDGKDGGGAEKNVEGSRIGPGTDITFIVEH